MSCVHPDQKQLGPHKGPPPSKHVPCVLALELRPVTRLEWRGGGLSIGILLSYITSSETIMAVEHLSPAPSTGKGSRLLRRGGSISYFLQYLCFALETRGRGATSQQHMDRGAGRCCGGGVSAVGAGSPHPHSRAQQRRKTHALFAPSPCLCLNCSAHG